MKLKTDIDTKKKRADLIRVFKALSDGNRLKILSLIHGREFKCAGTEKNCRDEICIKDLSARLSISAPTISHHVKELVNAGIIATRKKGRWVHCRVNRKRLAEAREFLAIFTKKTRGKL